MTFFLAGNKERFETSFLTGRSFFKTTIHEKVDCYIPITYFYENKLHFLFIKGKKCNSFNTCKSNKSVNVYEFLDPVYFQNTLTSKLWQMFAALWDMGLTQHRGLKYTLYNNSPKFHRIKNGKSPNPLIS